MMNSQPLRFQNLPGGRIAIRSISLLALLDLGCCRRKRQCSVVTDLLQFVPVFARNCVKFFIYFSAELNYFIYLLIQLNCSLKQVAQIVVISILTPTSQIFLLMHLWKESLQSLKRQHSITIQFPLRFCPTASHEINTLGGLE